ncbi:transglutaminase domain-containing protein [Clostridium paridis]|uniref:Transglutaminase-like domain-containing protein n=1 Tax=Clostridium paridis TaxID=2803863 RepID=A0A937FJF1_9CLOT|nr:transglutaminase domain-containing protein [Clostridium paridis]MBL4932631.1 hypothetical protein [Clostridium paridis]
MKLFKKISLALISVITMVALGTSPTFAAEKNNTIVITNYSERSFSTSSSYVRNPKLEYALYIGIRNNAKSIDVTSYTKDDNLAMEAYFEVLFQHPELFNGAGRVYAYTTKVGETVIKLEIEPTYLLTADDYLVEKKQFDAKVNSIYSSIITNNMSQLQKEKAIHDYIVKNTSYDDYDFNSSHSAYGVIKYNEAVCEGYAKAMKLFMDKAGIECDIVPSHKINHAWNRVRINGKYYQVDATWDDPVPDQGNTVHYNYFNLSDSQMQSTHALDPDTILINRNGWVMGDYGAWNYYDQTTGMRKTGWLLNNTKWYYFDASGSMKTGWTKVGTTYYYMDASGIMKTGWVKVGSTFYYMDNTGAMKSGWNKVGNSYYYMDSTGAMKTGWIQLSGKWYYLASSGAMKTGWVSLSNHWYYFYSNGTMAVNTTIGGHKIGSNGVML